LPVDGLALARAFIDEAATSREDERPTDSRGAKHAASEVARCTEKVLRRTIIAPPCIGMRQLPLTGRALRYVSRAHRAGRRRGFSSFGMGFALKRRRIKGDPASLQQ
jgi:hypothetical protein